MQWFDVDKAGLAKLLERKGKAFAVLELIQNALDTSAKQITVEIQPVTGVPRVLILVKDDDPTGFKQLSHAFTLFAESEKKVDVEKRGRFNLGEKLVLACCDYAEISTTTGTVSFTADGRSMSRKKTDAVGSTFLGSMRMTREEMHEAIAAVHTLIVPEGVMLTVNGDRVFPRKPVAVFEASLPTEVADAEGVLRRSVRKTMVRVYEPRYEETPSLYELGIPVVETGDRWHVDVLQKVPLNMDRDNVPPAYLRALRAQVLNATHALLEPEQASESWVRDAAAHPTANEAAVRDLIVKRFGQSAVRFDPSDPEANKRAAAAGYTVVHGGTMSSDEWQNVNKAGVLPPAGQLFPTRPSSSEVANELQPGEWNDAMHRIARYSIELAYRLMGVRLEVRVINNPTVYFAASYRKGTNASCLTFNIGKLGKHWFDDGVSCKVNSLLVHEFAHQRESDHLCERYHGACCDLGAQLAELALTEPEFFGRFK